MEKVNQHILYIYLYTIFTEEQEVQGAGKQAGRQVGSRQAGRLAGRQAGTLLFGLPPQNDDWSS
jgi:hypothetical protein